MQSYRPCRFVVLDWTLVSPEERQSGELYAYIAWGEQEGELRSDGASEIWLYVCICMRVCVCVYVYVCVYILRVCVLRVSGYGT